MSTPEDRGTPRGVVVAGVVLALMVLLGLVVLLLPGNGSGDEVEGARPVAGTSDGVGTGPDDAGGVGPSPVTDPSPSEGQPSVGQPSVGQPSDGQAPTDDASVGAGAGASGDPSGSASSCGLPDAPDVLPVRAPETIWELYGALAAPTSTTIGPGVRQDGIWSCYAPTAEGALFAAVNAAVHLGEHPDRATAIRALVADGPGRDVMLDAAAEDEVDSAASGLFVAGFNVLRYDDAADAVIDVLFGFEGRFVSFTMAMVWVDGDWLVEPRLNGGWSQVQQVPSAAGYIPWSA